MVLLFIQKIFKKLFHLSNFAKNRAIIWYAFGKAWLSSRGGGVVLKTMLCVEFLYLAYSYLSKLAVSLKLRGVCV